MYYLDFDDIPRTHYGVILADPPWAYNDKLKGHTFSLQYPTMGPKDLRGLPVGDIITPDAALFMWATSPQLPQAIDLMKAWGFRYKTVAFVWTKKTHLGNDVANLGRWTMGSTELCLLGTRGHPQRLSKNIHQLVTSVRGRHSEKPDEVRRRIDGLISGNRIELFARGECEGWDQFGNCPVYR